MNIVKLKDIKLTHLAFLYTNNEKTEKSRKHAHSPLKKEKKKNKILRSTSTYGKKKRPIYRKL